MKREELMAAFIAGNEVELSGIHPTYHYQTGEPMFLNLKGIITSIKRIEPYLFQVNFSGGSGIRVICEQPTYAVIRERRDAEGKVEYATPLKLPFTGEAEVKNWLKNYLHVNNIQKDEVVLDPHEVSGVCIYYTEY